MFNREQDWEFHPIQGETGEAFMGIRKDEKVFFKRNASPIITALSAEGVTPKLMWTQRTYSGDVLSAQEWTDGYTLENKDMADPRVIELIKKIHQSDQLIITLKRVGGQYKRPVNFIDDYFKNLPKRLHTHQLFNEVIRALEDSIDDDFYHVNYRVCHGDLTHHNFLMSEDDHLYLVDWEKVSIADPLSDLTRLLIQYYPPSQWIDWLVKYDESLEEIDEIYYKRIQWYSLINCLYLIKQYYIEKRNYKTNEYIMLLKSIFKNFEP